MAKTRARSRLQGRATGQSDRRKNRAVKPRNRRIRPRSPICVASVSVAEETFDRRDCATKTLRIRLQSAIGGGRQSAQQSDASRSLLTSADCDAFAAIGHPVRARLLRLLLDGPATYKSLRTHLELAAGPLYHHINQLRLAGLILPKSRDLYELTRGGRNLLAVAMAVTKLMHDRRRRPIAKVLR